MYENKLDPVPYGDEKDLNRVPPGYRTEWVPLMVQIPGTPYQYNTGIPVPESKEYVAPEWNHKEKVEFIENLRKLGKDYHLVQGECKMCNVLNPIDDHLLTEGAYDWIFDNLKTRLEERAKKEKEQKHEKK